MNIFETQYRKLYYYNEKLQKPSLFTTILDMAVLEKTGSRAGSLSLDNENTSSQTRLLHQNGEVEHNHNLMNLARRNTIRKRSFR